MTVPAPDAPEVSWTASPGAVLGAIAGTVVVACGLAFSRADVALLGLPLIVAVAWTRDLRPAARAAPATVGATVETAGRRIDYRLRVRSPERTEAVQVRLTVLGVGPRDVVVTPALASRLAGSVPILHSGPQPLVHAAHRFLGADAAWVSDPIGPCTVEALVSPPVVELDSLPLPRQLYGLTGARDSTRPGDGGDFRDVHPLVPGERLRRIDWRATARRAQLPGELYVRRTNASAEATVVVVIDSRDDVGENVADWGAGTPLEQGVTSLDLARTAASSLAVAYSRAGDRVGFQDLGAQRRAVRPGGGARNLDRVLRMVCESRPAGTRYALLRAPALPQGALVYVLSTFLDDDAARIAALWRAGGHRVIAVDTLPAPGAGRLDRKQRVAHRMLMMARADRFAGLVASGVEVLPWQEPRTGARSAALRALSRPGARR